MKNKSIKGVSRKVKEIYKYRHNVTLEKTYCKEACWWYSKIKGGSEGKMADNVSIRNMKKKKRNEMIYFRFKSNSLM